MAGKILLAEDDSALRETLAEALRAEGYEVVTAANGQAAIEAFEQEIPAVAILDGLLPKVNGFDVAKTFRVRAPDLPFIFMSGVFKSPQQQQEAREKYGCKTYLTKPFDVRRLVDSVKPLIFGGGASAGGGGGGGAASGPNVPQNPLPDSGTLLESPVLFLCWRAAKEMHTGCLELFGQGAGSAERARLFLFKGRCVFAQHSDSSLNVGVELIRSGAIDAEIYKQACDLAVQRGAGLYEVFKNEGWADEATMKTAYKGLVPRVIERVVAVNGRFRWVQTEQFSQVVPTASTPLLDPLFAGLRKTTEREIEPHVTPRRPLRLAPGDNWPEVAGRLTEACGTDSLARAINGRATIAQIIEASPNATERASRFRQVYMLMSTMAVRASLEPIAMSAPPPPVAQVVSTPDPLPVSPSPQFGRAPSVQVTPMAHPQSAPMSSGPAAGGGFGTTPKTSSGNAKPIIDENEDAAVAFTPDEEAARTKISEKFASIEGQNYFAVLGVKQGAPAADVKKAYFNLARDFHTDAFAGINLGSAQKKLDHVFQTIQTAYATLTDDKKRGEYEAKLSFESAGASTDVAALLAAEADMHKARTLVERGELQGALKLVEKVLVVAPKNEEYLGYKLYCTWWQAKNATEVQGIVKQLETFWKAAPGTLALKEFQGRLWMEIGDLRAAKIAFKRVLEVEPNHPGTQAAMRALSRKLEEAEKKASSGLGKFLKR